MCENGVLLSNGERAGAARSGWRNRSRRWANEGGREGRESTRHGTAGHACGPAQGVNVVCRSALRLRPTIRLNLK